MYCDPSLLTKISGKKCAAAPLRPGGYPSNGTTPVGLGTQPYEQCKEPKNKET